MIALDDFRFAMAIHTGRYVSFDMISFIIIFINRLNRDGGALFLPKAVDVPFLIVAALQCFSLTSSTTVKNHTKAKM